MLNKQRMMENALKRPVETSNPLSSPLSTIEFSIQETLLRTVATIRCESVTKVDNGPLGVDTYVCKAETA